MVVQMVGRTHGQMACRRSCPQILLHYACAFAGMLAHMRTCIHGLNESLIAVELLPAALSVKNLLSDPLVVGLHPTRRTPSNVCGHDSVCYAWPALARLNGSVGRTLMNVRRVICALRVPLGHEILLGCCGRFSN